MGLFSNYKHKMYLVPKTDNTEINTEENICSYWTIQKITTVKNLVYVLPVISYAYVDIYYRKLYIQHRHIYVFYLKMVFNSVLIEKTQVRKELE